MPNLSKNFYKKLLQVAGNVGMKPEDILNVMALESGLNPSAGTNAVGLVQFLPSTLKGHGYTGSASDFKRESAEEQLTYVERYIKGLKSLNNGKPFSSVTQYYIGNFIPAALQIPGVQREDSSTIICSKDPKEPHIPGVKINREKSFYNSNKGLDVDGDGNITYGDLKNKLNQVANGKIFLAALQDMKNATGYTPKNAPKIKSKSIKKKPQLKPLKSQSQPKQSKINEFNTILDQYLARVLASEKLNKELYFKYIPNNQILISLASLNKLDSIRFAKTLSSFIEDKLLAKIVIAANDKNINIKCDIPGPEKEVLNLVKEISQIVQECFSINLVRVKFGNNSSFLRKTN